MLGIEMFGFAVLMLLIGVPVAYAFGIAALVYALATPEIGIEVFSLLPYRIYGIMQNFTLISVPLFILMGNILERSEIAKELLVSLGELFGTVRGGLAIAIVLVGAILAATTGIVGASVVMMSVITLPIMIKHGYSKELSSGIIVASGTLGQIIPPSIVLIILGDVMHVSVADLFAGALGPGLLLIGLFILYILYYALRYPERVPVVESDKPLNERVLRVFQSTVAPLVLILAVLGSIFAGIASPTESASIGVIGAVILAISYRRFTLSMLMESSFKTVKLTGMIFMILIGATAFSLVFNEIGGSDFILELFEEDITNKWAFITLAMVAIFVLGFFVDFIEISFVVVPILVPIVHTFGIDPVWFAILIALNLQTSFLTPPFGFALFFLKGSSQNLLQTAQIYRGALPFITLQLIALALVLLFPSITKLF
jgi:tripartite ATP-independent transporter DctM subunit